MQSTLAWSQLAARRGFLRKTRTSTVGIVQVAGEAVLCEEGALALAACAESTPCLPWGGSEGHAARKKEVLP